jgi:hypothetical protein
MYTYKLNQFHVGDGRQDRTQLENTEAFIISFALKLPCAGPAIACRYA